ncbi:MAG: tetratricopeptide repeat protein [Thermoclostridium sp.]|nr:tetratricopeptide repeat protein [Thermoclostridium sp.]
MKKTGWMIGLAFLLVLFPLTAQAATESEYYEQGVALFGQGNYEDALKSFEEAARLNPEESVYYDWQGSCLYHMVAFDEALLAFDKALALEPYYSTYEYKGACLAVLGRTSEALAAFDDSIALYPYQNNYFWKAAMLMDLNRLPEAAATYLDAVGLDGVDNNAKALAYNNAGYVLYLDKQYAAAMNAVQNGLALKQDKPSLYKNKGLILEAQGFYTSAMENYDRALEIDPTYESALTARRNLNANLYDVVPTSTEAVDWDEIKLYVSVDKVWTITFNRPVDLNSAKANITVTDDEENNYSIKVEAGNDATQIKVSPDNEQGWPPSKKLTLFIPSAVGSTDGAKMFNGIKMIFVTK